MDNLSKVSEVRPRPEGAFGKGAAMMPSLPTQVAATAPEALNVPYVFGMD